MIIARVDPNVGLPAIVGGRGSCNLFVTLVGISGGGKGASIAAAAELLDFRGDRLLRVEHRTLGSGEGISAAFVERIKGEAGPDIVQHTDGVMFEVAEVDTLAALGARAGSSLMPELRKMWSGERLGFQNRDRTTSLPVEAHSYRASLIVGVQPARFELHALLGHGLRAGARRQGERNKGQYECDRLHGMASCTWTVR